MATLQKIRNRGGILVSIVIGLALVAFIVGDALSSGASLLNRSKNKVGEIGGESISIQDFQDKVAQNEETIKSMNQLPSLTEEQQRMIRENTWNQIVSENIMQKEYEELGLAVSSDELYDFTLGENMHPNIKQLFTNPQTGVFDKDLARQNIQAILNAPAGQYASPSKQTILVEHGRTSGSSPQTREIQFFVNERYVHPGRDCQRIRAKRFNYR